MALKKYIPDCITSLNLLCGSLGVVFALDGRVDAAFVLMLAAALFDFCDGLAARLLGAYSDFGKELDSISDVVSFGVLPSVMLVNMMRACSFSDSPVCYVPVILAVFSGVRLARFNVEDSGLDYFSGLPAPAAAMLCGSLAYYVAVNPGTWLSAWASGPVFVPALALAAGLLMVSRVPMFTLKFRKGCSDAALRSKRLAMGVVVAVVVVLTAVLRLDWSLVVLLTMTVYVVKNCIYAVFKV